jgi:hypothetical protein
MNSAALSEIAGELLVTVRELREELIQVRPRVLYIHFEENTGSCLAKLCTILHSVANPDLEFGIYGNKRGREKKFSASFCSCCIRDLRSPGSAVEENQGP